MWFFHLGNRVSCFRIWRKKIFASTCFPMLGDISLEYARNPWFQCILNAVVPGSILRNFLLWSYLLIWFLDQFPSFFKARNCVRPYILWSIQLCNRNWLTHKTGDFSQFNIMKIAYKHLPYKNASCLYSFFLESMKYMNT